MRRSVWTVKQAQKINDYSTTRNELRHNNSIIRQCATQNMQSVNFFIFPNWVLGQCEKINGKRFLHVKRRARFAQRLLCCSMFCLPPRARFGRESLPRLLEVKLRLRDARLVLQQRECPRRPVFCGSKLGLRMARVPNTLARLVEVKLWKSHRARAYTRTSIWAVKQARKIND